MRVCIVAAIVAVLLLAGCGGSSKRAAISSYITRVDNVERGMAVRLADVTNANRAFAKSQTTPKVAVKLAASERTLRTLQKRLSNVAAPPEAKRLRTLLLALVGHEVALSQELSSLSTFLPRFEAALSPLATADNRLKKQLGATAKGTAATKSLDEQKVAELEQYGTTVGAVIDEVKPLQPPSVWVPGYTAQLASLEQLQSSALALAGAMRRNDAASLPTLIQRFDAAAVSNQAVGVQKQQIAAVNAYDAQIKAIVALARQVQREQGRLQRLYA